jgi:hypothetical protein
VKLGNKKRAVEEYTALVNLRPDDPAPLCDLGTQLFNDNRYADAIPRFEKALELAPDYVDAWINLGAVRTQLGEHQAAVDCFRSAVEIDPQCTPALFNLGQVEYIREPVQGSTGRLGAGTEAGAGAQGGGGRAEEAEAGGAVRRRARRGGRGRRIMKNGRVPWGNAPVAWGSERLLLLFRHALGVHELKGGHAVLFRHEPGHLRLDRAGRAGFLQLRDAVDRLLVLLRGLRVREQVALAGLRDEPESLLVFLLRDGELARDLDGERLDRVLLRQVPGDDAGRGLAGLLEPDDERVLRDRLYRGDAIQALEGLREGLPSGDGSGNSIDLDGDGNGDFVRDGQGGGKGQGEGEGDEFHGDLL